MTDDSWDIEPFMNFHPCDKPHGMKNYVLQDITSEQQAKLNIRKREQVRKDQKYLADHPEIRGLIVTILRILMKSRPKYDIYEVIGKYFTKSSVDVKEEVYAYVEERENILSKNSTVLKKESEEDVTVSTTIEEKDDDQYSIEELVQVEDMEEPELIVLKKEVEEKDDDEHLQVNQSVRWEKEQKSKERKEDAVSVSSAIKACEDVISTILDNVFEEVDAPSMGSIASVGFPVDYEDHAFGSQHSSDESLD